jgi:hypothetical protein
MTSLDTIEKEIFSIFRVHWHIMSLIGNNLTRILWYYSEQDGQIARCQISPY